MFTSISLLSPFCPLSFFFFFFFFFELLLSFLLLGQASVASSLESKDSEGECRSFLLCFLFFLFFFYTFSSPSSSMAKPPTSLPSFSRFATVSSPFLQLALCPFSESFKKPEEQEEEVPSQEADTSLPFFLLSFFLLLFFFFLN